MDWQHAGIGEVDGQLERLREDLRLQVAMEGDAIAGREAALATVDEFNVIIRRCQEHETADKAEIDALLMDRLRLMRQRDGSS